MLLKEKTITHEELNEIINSIKPYAKTVCENIYNKTAEEIGGNDNFKSIIDRSFDPISEMEIDALKEYFNSYFNLAETSDITSKKIVELIKERKSIQYSFNISSRNSGKLIKSASGSIINKSVIIAFCDKIAEYFSIDLPEY